MKLIIQIPCFNESKTLPITLAELPVTVRGFNKVEWLIIDDGSSDDTAAIAQLNGVHHIVRHTRNQGLAKAFINGLHAAIELDADIIVNTDADNQYCAADIPKLVAPILEGRADIVVGARPISTIQHFSTSKKILQKLGSWVVRIVSRTDIPDAPSGFRAISREAAKRLMVFNDYTYTLETIIQAGQHNMAIMSVPIQVNGDLRPSRLVKTIPSYIRRSIGTMIRIFVIYRPFSFFGTIGLVLILLGIAIGSRFIFFWLHGEGEGHIQSLILVAILMGAGFNTILIAFVADLLAANRKLLENIRLMLSNKKER